MCERLKIFIISWSLILTAFVMGGCASNSESINNSSQGMASGALNSSEAKSTPALSDAKHELTAAKVAQEAAERQVQELLAVLKAEEERKNGAKTDHELAAAKAAQLAAERQVQELLAAEKANENTKVSGKDKQEKPAAKQTVGMHVTEVREQLKAGQMAPNFTEISLSGDSVSLEEHRKQVLIIDFFASWCQKCRTYLPALIELNSKYRKQGLKVIGMNVDDREQALGDFAAANQISYQLAQASDTTKASFGITTVPAIFVIDKNGRVANVFRSIDFETGHSIERLIKKLLAE